MTIKNLIDEKFGGCKKLSVLLGCRFPTTVYSWVKKDKIPPYRIYQILDVAKKHHIPVSRQDFYRGEA